MILRCSNSVVMGCPWAKDTDYRGLSRHRAGCKHYQRASTLASNKRRERARDSVRLGLSAHRDQPPQVSRGVIATSPLEPIRFVNHRLTIPIACCQGAYVFTDKPGPDSEGQLHERINPDESNALVGSSAPVSVSQDLYISMEDDRIAEGHHHIPAPHQHPSRRTFIPRNFGDSLPEDEDINPSDVALNMFGLSRQYPRRPSFEPDKFVPSSLLAKSSPIPIEVRDTQGPDPSVSEPPPYPFPNMTVYRLMMWMNSGSHQKSQTEVMCLVQDVIQAKDFNQKDLDGFSVRRCLHALDNHATNKESTVFPDDWVEAGINIDIPTKTKDEQSQTFSVPGFHYRPLAAVICSAFADIQANAFHLFPFKRLWKDPIDNQEQRVFDDLYTSDSWLEAQDDLQRQPKEPGCSLERVIAGLMFCSDATHLANFGTAKTWPLYLYFGNLSKYTRSSPTSGACHLVGFFPSHLILNENAFVDKLGPLGFDAFRILVVDFMHECELGTWKALFVHLVRLLYALPGGDGLVARLDNRFRQVPSYGNGVIRRFANNTSEMKKLATWDFENILQCAMPVFEGLFPADHDVIVQSLLYRFAHWHALAKLRVHTESTLSVLDETFKKL
ncbi:hypothetical protein P692DRAFT_20877483 [Suillus brevipes Sb2]|nr:hypothetical protein P692DRAFT_20877483 [Suillus brevipes Sb2]